MNICCIALGLRSQFDEVCSLCLFNLNRVGDKAIPATVYIEVVDREDAVEPLPSFTADSLFLSHFDVDQLQRKFRDELAGQGTGMIIDAQP